LLFGDKRLVEKEFKFLVIGLGRLGAKVLLLAFSFFYPFAYEDYTFDVRTCFISTGFFTEGVLIFMF
jgi:hypothetical protein